VVKLDGTTGEVLWSQHYASDEGVDEAALALATDAEGNAFITGYAMVGASGTQILTMKLAAANGSILWMDYRGGNDDLNDYASGIVVGADGHPVTTGIVVNTGNQPYYLTRKLNSADGSIIWEREIVGYANNISDPTGWLALMDNGDVVMTNRGFGSNGNDVMVQRYAAANGAVVWSTLYDGPLHKSDLANSMIRDAAGNIYVVGIQEDGSWNYDYMLLKFNGNDGSLVWLAEPYGSPTGSWYDAAACVTEAADGTIIISGFSTILATGWDIATVGYDPVAGSIIWSERINGSADASDQAFAVTTNGLGDIFVSGYASYTDTGSDNVTICYRTESTSPVFDGPVMAGLSNAWPNPFNPRITISFDLAQTAPVRLAVYDMRGSRIVSLVDESMTEGSHSVQWNGCNETGQTVSAGVYMAIFESGSHRSSRKIVLAK
jgi:hypothetical protein